jgi:CHAT domain-containing protein
MFIVCSETARAKNNAAAGEKLLSVGDPSFARKGFTDLPRLPSAAREAEGVAAYYRSPHLLTGSHATKEAVVDGMVGAEVAHLALHSVADGLSPMRSKLLLAEEHQSGSSGNYSERTQITDLVSDVVWHPKAKAPWRYKLSKIYYMAEVDQAAAELATRRRLKAACVYESCKSRFVSLII